MWVFFLLFLTLVTSQETPNIIIFYMDDTGYGDVTAYNQRIYILKIRI